MSPPMVYEETRPSTQRTSKTSAMVQSMSSPLRATPAANAGAYHQQHTADYCARADPGGNRALPFGSDLHVADFQNASLGTVAEAPEHNEGAQHNQYDSSNG
jgi:hypothetical protein